MDDFFFNLSARLTPEILQLIAEIDVFKGRWQVTQTLAPERLNSLRQVATIESVGSSTRIEGVKLTDLEIEKLLTGLKIQSFRSRDEQEVIGYAEAMDLVFYSFNDIPLTENHIKQLHGILLKYSEKDERHRGEYKKFSNHVEAFDADGKSLGVIFKTAQPFDTPRKTQELIEWVNKRFEMNDWHPLLIIAVFVVIFLAIHPFQDGNGRLSRILTTLLLLKNDYSYVPFCSLEKIIEENKDRYYVSLRSAQATLDTGNVELNDWLVFFLRCLQKQKNVLSLKIQEEELLAPLPQLSLQIVEIIKSRGRASVSDIVTLTKANRNTVRAHLKKLVVNYQLIQEGKGKGTWYRLG